MKCYSNREFIKLLKDNGYSFYRKGKGCHQIYRNGDQQIVISAGHLSQGVFYRLVSKYHLKVPK